MTDQEQKWKKEFEKIAHDSDFDDCMNHKAVAKSFYLAARKRGADEFKSWGELNIKINQQHTEERDQLKKQLEEYSNTIHHQAQREASLGLENEKLKALLSQSHDIFHNTSMWTQNESVRVSMKEISEVLGE
jgi:DNA phosphorothioation-dependent restriction protein DptG